MFHYPQQKQIIIRKQNVEKGSGLRFLCVYNDNLQMAMTTLSHSGFKVYVALIMNKPNFTLEYSPTHISTITGVSRDTAQKAIKELQQKGFISLIDKNTNLYEFNERPVKIKPLSEMKTKAFFDEDTGEIFNYTLSKLIEEVGEDTAKVMWEVASE